MKKIEKRNIGVIILSAQDMRRAVRFYAALGFELKFETPEFSEFSAGGVALALEARRAAPNGNGPAFAIPSEDIARDISLFKQSGARMAGSLEEKDFGRMAIFEDPEGNLFELVEYKK